MQFTHKQFRKICILICREKWQSKYGKMVTLVGNCMKDIQELFVLFLAAFLKLEITLKFKKLKKFFNGPPFMAQCMTIPFFPALKHSKYCISAFPCILYSLPILQ